MKIEIAPNAGSLMVPLYSFKNQNGKICTFLASNDQNVMANDENNWVFDVGYSKRVKNQNSSNRSIFTI